MYNSFFGFRAKPFNNEPELRFHYVTPAYAEAFNAIRQVTLSDAGVYCLTGEAGVGKTILLQRLATTGRNHGLTFIVSAGVDASYGALIDQLGRALELTPNAATLAEKLKWVQASLVERLRQGNPVVLAIDDAHRLAPGALTELLRFYHTQLDHKRALQLVLVGWPLLADELRAEAQTLAIAEVRYHRLALIADTEVGNYITQQLRAAGYQGNTIFSAKAIECIARYGQGSLRKLSLLCDAALLNAYLQSSRQVTIEIAEEAAEQHSLEAAQRAKSAVTQPEEFPASGAPASDQNLAGSVPAAVVEQQEPAREPSKPSAVAMPAGFKRYLALAAGLAVLLLGAGWLGTLWVRQGQPPDQPDIIVATPDQPADPSVATSSEPAATPTATTPADPALSAPVATTPVTPNSAATTATAAATVTTAVAATAVAATAAPKRPTFVTTPVTTPPVTIPTSTADAIADPRVAALLARAAEQIRAQQLIEPVGDNALETYLAVLQLDPSQQTALAGLRQLNQYYFTQAENAQEAKELFYKEAEAARQEQQRNLDQLTLAKQEKEQYLRDLSEYYVGQAILANRHKVDALVQAEIARQRTDDYLAQLTSELSQRNTRPPQTQAELTLGQTPLVNQQQEQLLAASRIERLLQRAQQQIAAGRLLQPKRDSALDSYQQVLQLEPASPEALAGIEYLMEQQLKRAEHAIALGNPQRAQYFLDQALEVDAGNLNLAARIREVRQQVLLAQQAAGSGENKQSPTGAVATRNLSATPELVEALLQSAEIGDVESVVKLLSSGAAPDVQDRRGNSALAIAAAQGHVEVVNALLRRGAKVNATNPFNETALMVAALNGHEAVAQTLLANGASPHSRDADGRTALMNASSHGYSNLVRLLLANGADPNMKSKNGSTALMMAAWNSRTGVAGVLLQQPGVDLEAKNEEGWTALSHAAWQGHVDIAKLLINKGADINARSNDGLTARAIASNRGYSQLVQLLQ